ncbi:MAG: DUF4232 domain-containing protein [Kutzneria sp.]|nr:DUF4232 domain-containing protein [Kutzneria sp.]
MFKPSGGALAFGALTVVLVSAGCGSPSTAAGVSSTAPSSSSAAVSGKNAPGPTAQPAGTKPTGPSTCATAGLKVSLGQPTAASNRQYVPIVFTNATDHTCTITGYPGAAFVAGDTGAQVGDPAQRDEERKPTTVTLAPGQAASATFSTPNTSVFDPPSSCQPTPVRGLRVYPPDNTDAAFVEYGGYEGACARTPQGESMALIKPVVPGVTGQ